MGKNIITYKLSIVIWILLSSYVDLMAQQSPQYSQYMFNGLAINPAYAGMENDLSLTFINRSQWVNIDGAPTTQSLTGHGLINDKNLGLGANLVYDQIGIHKNFTAQISAAYHIRLGEKSRLSLGLQSGINQIRSNYQSLNQLNQNDPRVSTADLSNTLIEFGTGFYFKSPRFHLGFSIPQLSGNTFNVGDSLSYSYPNMNSFIFSKYTLTLNRHLDLEPGVLIKLLKDAPTSYDIYTNFIFYEVLTTGLSYRKNESIDFLIRAQLTPKLQLGYAYDHLIGEISRLSNSSHEIMVNYTFRKFESKIVSPR